MAERMKQLISVLGGVGDGIVPVIESVKMSRQFETASGSQLSNIAKLVILREIDDKQLLRRLLLVEVALDESMGEFASVCNVIEALFETKTYRIVELGSARVRINVVSSIKNTSLAIMVLKSVLSAGIELYLTVSTGIPFSFKGGYGKGFGSVGGGIGIGGKLVSVRNQ